MPNPGFRESPYSFQTIVRVSEIPLILYKLPLGFSTVPLLLFMQPSWFPRVPLFFPNHCQWFQESPTSLQTTIRIFDSPPTSFHATVIRVSESPLLLFMQPSWFLRVPYFFTNHCQGFRDSPNSLQTTIRVFDSPPTVLLFQTIVRVA